MIIHEDGPELIQLNEFIVDIMNTNITDNVERSIFYPKLKNLLFREINSFCREHTSLRADLHFMRMQIGSTLSEGDIRKQFDDLLARYNSRADDNVGMVYHLEETRLDYGVVAVVILKRSDIHVKKFVFRFRKKDIGTSGLNFRNQSNLTEDLLKIKKLDLGNKGG